VDIYANKLKKNIVPYGFIVPALIIILLVMIYPTIYSFFLSFTNYNFGKPSFSFTGINNYIRLFTRDSSFYQSLSLTLYFVFVTVVFQVVVGMLMALALNTNHRFCGAVRALLIIPWALPGTIVAGIFI